MGKRAARLLAAVLCAAVLAGCGGRPSAQPGSTLSGVVNTDGSTSMEKLVKALGETFMEEHRGVTVNYSGSGSGAGVEGAVHGTVDIGLSSRALGEEEEASGAVAHLVALDGIAVIVHPENPIDDLTMEQLAGIFTGELSNWAQLGGADAPIAPCGREGGSGTRGAFEETIGAVDACAYLNEYSSSGDVIGSVAGNPNAIGYVSLASVGESVKALRVDGTECTGDTIRDGSYKIWRPFILVTREESRLSPAVRAFLNYAVSGDAAEIIALVGLVAPEHGEGD